MLKLYQNNILPNFSPNFGPYNLTTLTNNSPKLELRDQLNNCKSILKEYIYKNKINEYNEKLKRQLTIRLSTYTEQATSLEAEKLILTFCLIFICYLLNLFITKDISKKILFTPLIIQLLIKINILNENIKDIKEYISKISEQLNNLVIENTSSYNHLLNKKITLTKKI